MKFSSLILTASMLTAAVASADEGTPVGDEIQFGPAVTEITTAPGATFELQFNLTNTVKCTAFQFFIERNDNFTVPYDLVEEDGESYKEYYVDFGSRLTANYTVEAFYGEQTQNFKVVVYNSQVKKLMATGSGLFCTITYKVGEDVAPGTYELREFDAIFTWTDSNDLIYTIKPDPATITIKVEEKAGIEGIGADAAAGQMYDLMGRRIANPEAAAPGIYIKDGQKVAVK